MFHRRTVIDLVVLQALLLASLLVAPVDLLSAAHTSSTTIAVAGLSSFAVSALFAHHRRQGEATVELERKIEALRQLTI